MTTPPLVSGSAWSVPAIAVGLTSLVVAGLGAVHDGASASATRHQSTQAAAVSATGTAVHTDVLAPRRSSLVSRDSQRDALADASDVRLQKMAEAQAQQRNAALAALASSAEKFASKLADQAWVLPVTGYQITATFGEVSGLWSNTHTGLDFAAPEGTPIMAVAEGQITEVGWAGAYGNRTVETLKDGTELWYCHQSAIAVRAGDPVDAGQVIGAIGATGNVTGPHLHLEVRPGAGDPVDPYQALVAHGLKP